MICQLLKLCGIRGLKWHIRGWHIRDWMLSMPIMGSLYAIIEGLAYYGVWGLGV